MSAIYNRDGANLIVGRVLDVLTLGELAILYKSFEMLVDEDLMQQVKDVAVALSGADAFYKATENLDEVINDLEV